MASLDVAVLIDLPERQPYFVATLAAIEHAAAASEVAARSCVVRTDQLDGRLVSDYAGVVVGPGSPYRDPDAAIAAIRTARERGIPLVGTWGGFQHVLVEHARTLVGIGDAAHAEYGDGGTPVITLLACSLMEQQITIQLTPESRVQSMYGVSEALERTTCNYGLAPELQDLANAHGMRVAAIDATGEVRAIERTDHPFFVGTLFQPQLRSTPAAPHPVFTGLMEAMRGGPRQ